MASFHQKDTSIAQIASALPFNVTAGGTRSYPEQITMEPHIQEALQPHPGLGGRGLYSKEQWDAQKSVIHQLYNVENKPYKRVVNILRTKHNFFPTKRQFYRKIKEWGFEKNIKDEEMRTIVQGLNQRGNDEEDHNVELRGQRVDPVKIQRWQRRHRRSKDVARPFSSNLSNPASSSRSSSATYGRESPMEASESLTLDRPTEVTQPSQVTDDSKRGCFDWSLVDIPGSPFLTRLFKALTMECESTIPSLDLTSSSPSVTLVSIQEVEPDVEMSGDINHEELADLSTSAYSQDLVRYSQEIFPKSDAVSTGSNPGLDELSYSEWSLREWDFSRTQPLRVNTSAMFGLSPYPVFSEAGEHRASEYKYFSPDGRSQFLKEKEMKCKSKLNKLKKTLGADHSKILVAKKDLASTYYERDKCKQAERLYRHIAITYERTLGLNHPKTLSAYLDVVKLLYSQAKRLKARNIHQHIHDTIIKLVDQDDTLALRSNFLRSGILYDLGQLDEAEKLIRQTLQAHMNTLGPRHEDTLYDMKFLARTLKRCNKLVESEQLQRLNSQLYLEEEGPFSQRFLDSLHRLAVVLNDQGRYDECKSLAMTVADRFGTLMGPTHHNTLYNHFMVAVCTRRQGDFSGSERQLRSVLQKQIETLGEKNADTCDVLRELSGVLGDMGRYPEAAILLKKSYEGLVKTLGISHTSTLWCCQDLGDIYGKLGRYEDAIAFLQRNVDDARVLGDQPSEPLLGTISKLAGFLGKVGRYAEALSLYEECFEGFVRIYGISDPSTTYIIESLGWYYEELGRYNDALGLYQPYLDQVRSIEGDQHPTLLEISEWMTTRRDILASSIEKVDENQEDAIPTKSPSVEVLINEGDVDMHERLTGADSNLTVEDWMEEFIDIRLLQNSPFKTLDSDEVAQVDEALYI